jgi:hypothetical protein
MRVLELFAGTLGWGSAFRDRGHDVFAVELETDFPGVDLYGDVAALKPSDLPWKPDIILASPPCTSFSMMSVRHHWTRDGQPKSETARLGGSLVMATIRLADQLRPDYLVIENPVGRLASIGFVDALDRKTIWQCRYGRPYAKPTDLFGVFPPSFVPLSCWNGNTDHTPAVRGSKTGVQGGSHGWYSLPESFGARFWSSSPERKQAQRAVAAIPYALSEAMCIAAEQGGMPMTRPVQMSVFA